MYLFNNNVSFSESNLGRACGINTQRSWYFDEEHNGNKKISYLSAFFLSSEWNEWLSAIQACWNGQLSEPWQDKDPSVEHYSILSKTGIDREKISQRIDCWINKASEVFQNKFNFKVSSVAEDSFFSLCSFHTELSDNAPQVDKLIELFEYKFKGEVYGMAAVKYSDKGSSLNLSLLARNPFFMNEESRKVHKVGTLIISEILKKSLDENRIKNFSFTAYESSIPFYKRLGFKFTREGGPYVVINRDEMQRIFNKIQKKLDETGKI
jgi:hypothetical protein